MKTLVFYKNKNGYKPLLFFQFLLLSIAGNAQLLTPLSNEMNRRVEYEMMKSNTPFFTAMKPYVDTQLQGNARQDSLNILEPRVKSQEPRQIKDTTRHSTYDLQLTTYDSSVEPRAKSQEPRHKSWLNRKLFHESFIQVDSSEFYIFADPVFEFGLGREIGGINTYINTRGFRAGGRLGKHVAFGMDFYENQGIFNSVVTQKIKKNWAAPGEGFVRKYDSIGFDYAYSTGYVSFMLLKKLNIQFAQGRQFVGDGYRSLLLSDASFPYPYVKFSWHGKYLQYSWCNMLLQNYWDDKMINVLPPYRRKLATMHSAGVNLKNKLQLAIVKFQVFNNPDSSGLFTMNFNQLNPIMLPINSDDSHSIWGITLSTRLLKSIVLYNQIVFDNLLSDNIKHVAVQGGIKYYGNWGKHSIFINAEYNRVPPLTYTSDYKVLNWKHYREPLAHPYGYNFEEGILIGSWNYKRWQLNGQANISSQLEQINDIKPYTNLNLPFYSNNKKLNWYNAEFSYYLNSKTLMHISLGLNYRIEDQQQNENTMKYFYFSFGTRLFNKYYDF